MANIVDPDQTAPIGAVCSGSMLFASILNSSVMLGNYLQQRTSAEDIKPENNIGFQYSGFFYIFCFSIFIILKIFCLLCPLHIFKCTPENFYHGI